MKEPSTLEILARRLNYAGMALLLAAAAAFVWAVGFTRGVEGLIEGLVFTGLGLFLPAVATLWVASVVGSAAVAPARHMRATVVRPRRRRRWVGVALGYAIAAIAVLVAALIRVWLAPYLGGSLPYATFFLAVAIAAWAGGMGPGTLAAVATLIIVRRTVLDAPVGPTGPTGEWVGAALFFTVALAIAGITSALRVARSGNLALRADLESRDAEREEQEARMRELADEAPSMLWWSRPDGRCAYVNAAWRVFTGRTLDEAEGDGWHQGIHPDDAARWRKALTRALRERAPYAIVYRRQAHDGMYRDVRDEAKPRLVAERDFAGFIGRTTILGDPAARIELASGEAASS